MDFFLCTVFNTASSPAPQIAVSEDAGIEPRTVATSALAARRSANAEVAFLYVFLYLPYEGPSLWCYTVDLKTFIFLKQEKMFKK